MWHTNSALDHYHDHYALSRPQTVRGLASRARCNIFTGQARKTSVGSLVPLVLVNNAGFGAQLASERVCRGVCGPYPRVKRVTWNVCGSSLSREEFCENDCGMLMVCGWAPREVEEAVSSYS